MKKKRSRIGAVVMAAALALTMGQSVTLYAEENPAGDVSQETQQIVSDEGSGNDLQNEDQATEADDSETNAGADVQDVQTQAVEEDSGKADTKDVESSNDTEDTADKAKEPSAENTEALDDTSVDVNKPVIEKVEFDQQGQTLKDGDTVTFRFYAYDADSGIKRIYTEIYYDTGKNTLTYETIEGEYDESLGCYVASMELENVGTGRVDVGVVRAIDYNSNYTDYVSSEGLWFETEGQSLDANVEEFYLSVKGQELSYEELDEAFDDSWIKLDQEIPYDTLEVEFTTADKESRIGVSYSWNSDEQRYEKSGNAWVDYVSGDTSKAEFVLSDIYVQRFGGYESIPMDGMENYTVTVKFSQDQSEEDTDLKITSVTLDKNGEIVRDGEEVKLTVTVDNPDNKELIGSAVIYSAADIIDSVKMVDLVYSEEEQAYTGVFTVDESYYPCEWYLTQIDFAATDYTEFANLDEFYPDLSATYPWYFNVYRGESFVADTHDITIDFYRQDGDGWWSVDSSVTVENVARRASLKDMGVSLPEFKSGMEGVKQTGWKCGDNLITEDTILLTRDIDIQAVYEESLYNVSYRYLNKDGEIEYAYETVALDEASPTIGDYREAVQEFMPDDMTDSYELSSWTPMDNYMENDDSLPINYNDLFNAEYAGKKILSVDNTYVGKDGKNCQTNSILVVDENASYDDIVEYANSLEVPELYSGLRFSGWKVDWLDNDDDGNLDSYEDITISAQYENCIIRYQIIDRNSETFSDVFCQLAEIGDTVTYKTSFEGYTDLEWPYEIPPKEGETFVVDSDNILFYVYASPVGEETPETPETPGTPETPETPETPDKPVTPEEPETPEDQKPAIELPTEEVNTVVEEIKNATAGQTVTVDMGSATVVSKDILEAAKGKDVDIVLDMGGYTWTINGKDIVASNLSDINLEVTMGTTNIPNNLVSALAQGRPVQQISLTHNGDFGFRASLTLNVGSQYAGQYGNLYYYDSDGRMVFMNAGAIGENGNVTLSFSHASDYAIVISDEELSQADADRANSQVHASADSGKPEEAKVQEVSVQTGDNANVLPIVMILIVSAAVVAGCVVIIRRNRMKR